MQAGRFPFLSIAWLTLRGWAHRAPRAALCRAKGRGPVAMSSICRALQTMGQLEAGRE